MITGILMSLNDHGWGNDPKRGGGGRNNQGPPDLDELWRDFNRRLSGMFGKKRGGPAVSDGSGNNNDEGGGPNFPNLTPGQFGGGIGLLIGLVAVVWLASGFYIVDANQRGVVLKFGKYKRNHRAGFALASAMADPVARNRQPDGRAHRRGRLSRLGKEQGAQGGSDADR